LLDLFRRRRAVGKPADQASLIPKVVLRYTGENFKMVGGWTT
jgi:hypothetical protein